MKSFIFILFLIFFKGNDGQIYKTLFIPDLQSIVAISDSSIKSYYYPTFTENSLFWFNFEDDEQKITSTNEGDMVSMSYLGDSNCKEIFIIIKNYIYFLGEYYRNNIQIQFLNNRITSLVLEDWYEEQGTYFCNLFICFVDSENKLQIFKLKQQYISLNFFLLNIVSIDLMNSSGQISLNNCEIISCQKAKNEDDFVLVCFYENDKSEIGALTLNLETLESKKEVKFKENNGAKSIKSVLFDNNEKVFVCYINNNDNIACVIFDEPQNKFLNELTYIEKMTQPQRYFNLDYFPSTNQYILSAYSSETEFEYIIFDENMNVLDNSIYSIDISPCNDESSFLSFTIYYDTNYNLAQKCGNNEFSSQLLS